LSYKYTLIPDTSLQFIIIILMIIQSIGHSGPVPVQNYWTDKSIWTFSRTPWKGDQPDASLYLHRITWRRKTRTHIHAPSGFRTRDSSVRAVEDSTYLGPCGHSDRH